MLMKKLMIYRLGMERFPDSYILKYKIDDKFESQRYYFLSLETCDIYRIKNIDHFIEFCEINNIDIEKLKFSKEQLDDMIKLIEYIVSRKASNKLSNVFNKYNECFYNSLDKSFIDYDYNINNKIDYNSKNDNKKKLL